MGDPNEGYFPPAPPPATAAEGASQLIFVDLAAFRALALLRKFMKKLICLLLVMVVPLFEANGDSGIRMQAIEKEGLTIARGVCGEDLGCKILVESYDEAVKDTSDPSGRSITFTALALYIVQTLGPKLPQSEENKAKVARMNQLFDDHMASE